MDFKARTVLFLCFISIPISKGTFLGPIDDTICSDPLPPLAVEVLKAFYHQYHFINIISTNKDTYGIIDYNACKENHIPVMTHEIKL